jgi:hypothetical protein
MGIEPGDPETGPRSGSADPGHGTGVGRAIAAEDQQLSVVQSAAGVVRGADQGPGDVVGQPRQVGADPGAVPGPWILVGDPAGLVSTSPASRSSAPASPGRARRRASSPRARSSAGVRSIPSKWPPSAVGEPTITIRRAIA